MSSTTTPPPTLPVAVLPNGNVQMASGAIIDGKLIDATSKAANATSPVVQQMGNKSLLANGNTVVSGSANSSATPHFITANKSSVIMTNGNTVHANHLNMLPPIAGTSAADAASSANSSKANGLQGSAAPPAAKSDAHQIAAISANHASNVNRGYGNHASASRHAEIASKHLWLAQQAISNQEYYPGQHHMGGRKEGHRSAVQHKAAMGHYSYGEHFDPSNSSSCNIAPPHPATQYCKAAPFNSVSGARYFYVGEAYGVPTSG